MLSNFIFSQGYLIIGPNTQIVATNDPIVTLDNTNLINNTTTSDFGNGPIWKLSGNSDLNGTVISKFYGLILNNTNGLTLSTNTTISNRLDMISPNITTNGNTLEIGTSPTNLGILNWTSGTIIGPLKRWFAPSINSTQASAIFPIGNDPTTRYFTINYTQAPTSGGFITGEYKLGIPSQTNNYAGFPFTSSDGQVVENYAVEGYFEITPDDYNGSLNNSQYTIKMRGVNISNVNDYTILRLVKNLGPNHTGWVPCGTHSNVVGNNSDFTITSTNVVGFSWFNFGGNNNNPLPVELTLFDGIPYPLFNVIKWTTASENNSDYFDLEQSVDGENWKVISNIKAVGNSTTEQKYSFIDNNRNPITYYRLQQFDIDGQFKTYGPIIITKTITNKKVVKYINLLGQEIKPDETTGVVIEIYEDGTMKKTIR